MQNSGLLVALVLLPLLGAALARGRAGRWAAAVALWAMAAMAAYLRAVPLGVDGELAQPLWRVLAVQRLRLEVGLELDRWAAVALLLWGIGAGWAAVRAERRQAAWLAGAGAALAVALLGDALLTRLCGWEGLTVAAWALSVRRRPAPLWLGRAGDATLLLSAALLFWGLGGSWSSSRLDSRYQIDFQPARAGAASAPADAPASELGPTLALRELPTVRAPSAPRGAAVQTVRAALANKLWLGSRLLTWLTALFAVAVALKSLAGALQLAYERRQAAAVSGLLLAAALSAGWHLLGRLR